MTDTLPLYRRVLGPCFDRLPREIQTMHDGVGQREAAGRCRVERGGHPLARLVAWLFRFPPAGDDLPVTVRFEGDGRREVWRRRFGQSPLTSVQEIRDGMTPGRLIERFGPFAFELAVPSGPQGLRLEPRRMWLWKLPIPSIFLPRIDAGETVENGRFIFDVRIDLPLVGQLVHYAGHLVPVGDRSQGDAS